MQSSQTEATLRYPSGISSSSQGSSFRPAEPIRRIQVFGGPLLQPLILEVEDAGNGQTLVADDLVSSYGVGDTLGEALEEFLEMLLELRQELDESRGELARPLAEQLRILDFFLSPLH